MDANSGPVVLVNLFEVPAEADDRFIAAWEAARDFLAAQDGYQSTALHRGLGPDAEFREAAAAIQHRAHPGLYEVIRR